MDPDGAANDNFGNSAAISGETAVVGALGDDSFKGSACVFVRSGAMWSQQQKLTASDGVAGDLFGAVAISADTVVIGAFRDDIGVNTDQGSVYTFVCSGCPTITLSPTALPNATVGTSYNETITAGGGAAPYQFSVSSGSLPPGLTLAQGGLLSGIPVAAGSYSFTITATAANLCPGSRSYTVIVTAPCPAITFDPLTLPTGIVGTSYNQTLTATGGTAPYSFAVTSGALPPGLSLSSSGSLSGIPSQASTFNFTVRATDANNCTGSRSYSLTINGVTMPSGLQYYPLPSPVRLLDTRPGESACFTPGAPLGDDAVLMQQAVGTCSGIPASARAIVGNATVVNFISSGFHWITLYPSDAQQPNASNLNFSDDQIVPNNFTVGLGPDGAFNIYSQAATHFIVDITGYYAPRSTGGLFYHPLPFPVRLFDSRPGQTACDAPGVPLADDGTQTVLAHRSCLGATIPSSAKAIVGNATVVNFISTGLHWITLYPFGSPPPNASNLNFTADQIVPTAFVVGLSTDGNFNIYSHAATHFIIDLTGFFAP